MNISMLDPAAGNAEIQSELDVAAISVLNSGKFILGEAVSSFENKLAKYLGVKKAVAVSSGTDALLLALMGLDIGPGDEVICPSFTFFATAGSVVRVGATPVFADINLSCFTSTADQIKPLITDKTKAIIPVHLFGQCADMNSILELAKDNDIKVIEDVAQAMGASINDKMAGSMGDVGCFSFFPSKNLGGFGDGGLVSTNDEELGEKLLHLRNHGMTRQYHHTMIGGNFRMDALQAALLEVKLGNLDKYLERRRENALLYEKGLSDFYILPKEVRGKHTYNQFTLMISREHRDDVQKYLRENHIGSAVYYPKGLHEQPCFKDISNGLFKNTEIASSQVLSIPIAPEVTTMQIDEVISKLNYYPGM